MNYYPSYNQFYGQTIPQGMPKIQPMEQQFPQYAQPQPIYKQPVGLQGKSVDSIDVVKAMDIPLDFSISYFPLTDGTAIVTKQLQQDGSSKTMVYKPVVEEKENKTAPNYVTIDELNKAISDIDLSEIWDLKEQIQDLKKQIKEIMKKSKGD